MYYLCKSFRKWSLYNTADNSDKDLKPDQVEVLKALFPNLMKEGVQAFEVIQISPLNSNKIANLKLQAPEAPATKLPVGVGPPGRD